MLLTGIYSMINGIDGYNELFTRGISLILIGIGIYINLEYIINIIKNHSNEDEF